MTSRIDAINITCRDHESLGAFWQQVLGLQGIPDNSNEPGDPETMFTTGPIAVNFLFQPPEPGADFAPRIHFDVDAVDLTRGEEVQRCIDLGAELVVDRRRDDGSGWVTLRDPDGYEFCVQRSAEEIARTGS